MYKEQLTLYTHLLHNKQWTSTINTHWCTRNNWHLTHTDVCFTHTYVQETMDINTLHILIMCLHTLMCKKQCIVYMKQRCTDVDQCTTQHLEQANQYPGWPITLPHLLCIWPTRSADKYLSVWAYFVRQQTTFDWCKSLWFLELSSVSVSPRLLPQTDQDIKPWYLHRSPSSYHRPIRTSCHDTRTGHHHTTDRSGHHAMTPSQVTFIMPQTDLHHSLHPYGILWLWRSFSMQVLLTGNLESYWPVTVLYCCNCL